MLNDKPPFVGSCLPAERLSSLLLNTELVFKFLEVLIVLGWLVGSLRVQVQMLCNRIVPAINRKDPSLVSFPLLLIEQCIHMSLMRPTLRPLAAVSCFRSSQILTYKSQFFVAFGQLAVNRSFKSVSRSFRRVRNTFLIITPIIMVATFDIPYLPIEDAVFITKSTLGVCSTTEEQRSL